MLKKASQLFHKKLSSDNLNNEEEPEIPRVYNELYFYGRITRQEAEEILAVNGMEDGLYLLRESITPMGNFSLSMAYEGRPVHYSIEKKIDGQFMIAEGVTFRDPVALIQHYQTHKTGFVTVPKIPCCRRPDQDAIAFRGLSYQDLHTHMRSAARNMNANLSRALGPMRESLLMHVLRTMHEKMPWFHGTISRDECIKRLEESGHESGKFIIRTRTDGQTFALTMSHEGTMRHYFILVNDGETYSIENGHRFKALIILVDHYHNKRDGLPCRLSVPCPSPDTMHNAWENYRKLSKNLTQKPGIRGQVREETNSDPALPPRRPPARTPDRPPPPIPQHEPLFWDRPVQDVEEDDDIENMPSPLGPAISQEQAEQLESIYIDIRQDVLSKDLRPDQVILEGKLGSGQFGEVRKGMCQLSKSKTVPVAVKTLKNNDPAGEREILSEANLMKTLNHQHIVRMIGVCKGESLMLVMELAELGPLKKYLERHLEMKLSHQVEMMLQICDGMTYLESMDVVHRDLAARNVLLVTDHFAKISDFGMSRMVDNSSEYYLAHGPGRWPLMWYAPECLYYHKFDHKSDVWSFGVTMWEIMSFGARPYDRKKPQQILHFIESGNRLSKPRNCDDRIYRIMLSCWEFTKDLRPNFSELKDDLKKLYAEFLRDQR
ncbi:tyrosine-protein kinase SYK-like [Physella acuta]|uniref:tyrosine-protein kinase SYK-like n=1 Tax=Physella acuta TaxID=109671 RepID=UPI0027DDBCAC|nr:tyrosine-protein kinase SYK-like [Physella acuta]